MTLLESLSDDQYVRAFHLWQLDKAERLKISTPGIALIYNLAVAVSVPPRWVVAGFAEGVPLFRIIDSREHLIFTEHIKKICKAAPRRGSGRMSNGSATGGRRALF